LEGVEADEAALIVGLYHKKNDSRDNGDVSQHSRHVVSESGARGGYRDCGTTAAGRASCHAIGNLCTTLVAKCHWSFLDSLIDVLWKTIL
jgi:hypothetical protein